MQHTSNWETWDYTMVASTPMLPPKVIKNWHSINQKRLHPTLHKIPAKIKQISKESVPILSKKFSSSVPSLGF